MLPQEDGGIKVRTIMKGGSAEHDATVMVGDTIQTVDKVQAAPNVKALKQQMMGEVGTYVTLGLGRCK